MSLLLRGGLRAWGAGAGPSRRVSERAGAGAGAGADPLPADPLPAAPHPAAPHPDLPPLQALAGALELDSSSPAPSGEPPPDRPILRPCSLPVPAHRAPVQAWLESLRKPTDVRLGLVDLHPDVFAVAPRLDILHQVVTWQRNFKRISYAKTKTRAEVRGGGRKPWRQKGSGRARHGSIRSPLWRGGGVAHGPRGPTSYYYMLPMKIRVLGLKVALTTKLAQDNLHIVDSLELPTSDPQYLMDLVQYRHWGDSVLIVDVEEQMPQNIVSAVSSLKKINLMHVLGLNVYSILRFQTLVLTLDTVSFLEEKLLWHDFRYSPLYPFHLPYSDMP
ncbi:LOW QUALITY PROTEIN: 39S ribosomal protein L4, mitochondrial [Tachyglossus aculeatus]|uniref:LOW QUALITY PROTEIN: 39S ribosomal protein L4, mitochondrial n=1 Tax=Tachyglossus aculeatus TaxID=9261 RepID=UPI0018F2EA27|nr:LOW QUALITY PROTEIN: 39S ribosomal protein L4, mitochondrial [Tachyglossus aculeatus]